MNGFTLLAATVVPQAADIEMNMWTMIVKGGWLMIPIFILSVIGVYIMCERFFIISKAGKMNRDFMEKINNYMYTGDKSKAVAECSMENTPVSHMIHKGILYSNLPTSDLRATMESSANIEISLLEKGLSTLSTVAGMAPMIGFLGTVVGMVQAFYDMSLAGNNINISLLSRGIYTAMITTVAGLIVGIIAYFGYNALVARIDKIATLMESACSEFIDNLYELKNKK